MWGKAGLNSQSSNFGLEAGSAEGSWAGHSSSLALSFLVNTQRELDWTVTKILLALNSWSPEVPSGFLILGFELTYSNLQNSAPLAQMNTWYIRPYARN